MLLHQYKIYKKNVALPISSLRFSLSLENKEKKYLDHIKINMFTNFELRSTKVCKYFPQTLCHHHCLTCQPVYSPTSYCFEVLYNVVKRLKTVCVFFIK